MLGPYAQISDVQQDYFSEYVHSLDIGIFGPYAKISDVEQGHISDLPDIHTLDIGFYGPYVKIYDVKQNYFFEFLIFTFRTLKFFYHHELPAHAA